MHNLITPEKAKMSSYGSQKNLKSKVKKYDESLI